MENFKLCQLVTGRSGVGVHKCSIKISLAYRFMKMLAIRRRVPPRKTPRATPTATTSRIPAWIRNNILVYWLQGGAWYHIWHTRIPVNIDSSCFVQFGYCAKSADMFLHLLCKIGQLDSQQSIWQQSTWHNNTWHKSVCRGSVVVTAHDSESGRLGSNPEWG